ncbi:MAG TPA: hypothetical protein VIT67_18410 [Povalibacter sp.]
MSYYDELSGAANSPNLQNRLLFELLCDDTRRLALYQELRNSAPVFKFSSRAPRKPTDTDEFPQQAYLITRAKDIDRALTAFSNDPYKAIGSGNFVLALDDDEGHQARRTLLGQALRPQGVVDSLQEIHYLAAQACHQAMVAPTKQDAFDLATDIAEQSALRFVAAYFGLPDQLHFPMQDAMRRTYTAMIYQMFARHFVKDAQVLEQGNTAMKTLAGYLVAVAMKDMDNVPLIATLTQIADTNSKAPELFREWAHAATELKAIEKHARAYLADFGKPGLAARTGVLLDRMLDYPPLRMKAIAKTESSVHIDAASRDALTALLNKRIAGRQFRDSQLVPRLYALDGNEMHLLPESAAPAAWYCKESVLERMVRSPTDTPTPEIAVAVIGSIAGVIGNVIASVCIVIERYFQLDHAKREQITQNLHPLAGHDDAGIRIRRTDAESLYGFIAETLYASPPPPFVPRMTVNDEVLGNGKQADTIPSQSEVIVPLGAATSDPDNKDFHVDPFGSAGNGPTSHRCLGDYIGRPLIAHVLRNVLTLPGLAQVVVNGEAVHLRKKWGFICESLPLRFDSSESRRQSPLNVVMKIRSPVAEHAAALKVVLQSSVPAIERVLTESKIVHFARFVFLSNDTELGLFTVYDDPFKDYIEHFARVAGLLFDKIFEHIEEQPPMPVHEHPTEFVEFIARHNVPSAAGYFFSAHPLRTVREGQR